MTALPNHENMSVEDYLQLDRETLDARYEYLDGEIIMLAGAKEDHNLISGNMFATLWNFLLDTECRVYGSDMRVRLSEKRYVYPDVTVACKPEVSEEDILENPRVLIEVLSPSTEMVDRGKKFSGYKASPSVEEYVLVSTDYKKVEIFKREKKNFWTYQELGPEDEFYLRSLDIHFPVATLYRNVDVPDVDTSE